MWHVALSAAGNWVICWMALAFSRPDLHALVLLTTKALFSDSPVEWRNGQQKCAAPFDVLVLVLVLKPLIVVEITIQRSVSVMASYPVQCTYLSVAGVGCTSLSC